MCVCVKCRGGVPGPATAPRGPCVQYVYVNPPIPPPPYLSAPPPCTCSPVQPAGGEPDGQPHHTQGHVPAPPHQQVPTTIYCGWSGGWGEGGGGKGSMCSEREQREWRRSSRGPSMLENCHSLIHIVSFYFQISSIIVYRNTDYYSSLKTSSPLSTLV